MFFDFVSRAPVIRKSSKLFCFCRRQSNVYVRYTLHFILMHSVFCCTYMNTYLVVESAHCASIYFPLRSVVVVYACKFIYMSIRYRDDLLFLFCFFFSCCPIPVRRFFSPLHRITIYFYLSTRSSCSTEYIVHRVVASCCVYVDELQVTTTKYIKISFFKSTCFDSNCSIFHTLIFLCVVNTSLATRRMYEKTKQYEFVFVCSVRCTSCTCTGDDDRK